MTAYTANSIIETYNLSLDEIISINKTVAMIGKLIYL